MTHKDFIIVGGGIAGLTAALSLAHKGKGVLLIEKNERCGGLMNSFVRDGFRFEGGARALVNAGLVKPLIKEFGLDIEVMPNPITLGIEDKTLLIEGERSLDDYARLLKGLYPGNENEVERIVGAIHDIIEDMKVLYGVVKPLFTKKKNVLTLKMIWAGDLKALYAMSNEKSIREKDRDSFARRKEAVLGHRGAESVFSVFLATDIPPEAFGRVSSGHVFYTPDRRGLGNVHTAELKDLLGRWDTVRKDEVYAWLRRFCRYNTFEISIPALRDPDAAPAGKTGIIISALFDYELTGKIRATGWYDEFKRRMEEEFIGTISSSIYPGLKDKVLFSFSASPSSIYHRVRSSEGSIVGWSFEGDIPVVTSMFHMADSVKTALPDVYAAGKWVFSPAGGPIAIMTGRIAAKLCLRG